MTKEEVEVFIEKRHMFGFGPSTVSMNELDSCISVSWHHELTYEEVTGGGMPSYEEALEECAKMQVNCDKIIQDGVKLGKWKDGDIEVEYNYESGEFIKFDILIKNTILNEDILVTFGREIYCV